VTDAVGVLADTLMLRNHVEEALPLREDALALVRTDPGATPKDLAIALGALGSCHQQLQEPELADRPLTESLEIFRRDVGGPDPGYASTLSNLGSLRLDQGRFEEAEELLEEALVMFLALFGDEQNHNAVTTLANLGALKVRRER
jgi:tetratricopeptide (TPR) repeat protein